MEENDLWLRRERMLEEICQEGNPDDEMYIYRLNNGVKIKPAILHGNPFTDLYAYIQENFGAGSYTIMIRTKRVMRFTHTVHIAPRLS